MLASLRCGQAITSALTSLLDASNTVIVIENDMQEIAESNWIIYIGPGAGKGGRIILYSGNVDRLLNYKETRQPHFSTLSER